MKRDTTLRDRHRAVIRRGNPACALCGDPIRYDLPYPHPESYVVDHTVPLIHGGADTLENKRASHQACNRAKGDRLDGGPIIKRSGSLRRTPAG